jgi:hypothetical protein
MILNKTGDPFRRIEDEMRVYAFNVLTAHHVDEAKVIMAKRE